MKNKTQSDLHYAYKQCVGKINYYLTCIEIEKNTHWDIWSVYDYEIFLKLKKQKIGEYREVLKDLINTSKNLKRAIKNCNKEYDNKIS